MLISDKWTQYELLDCSGGERLERWGAHILVRPDPQVIWDTGALRPEWRAPDARYVRSSAGGGQWERKNVPESWEITYGDLTFSVRPTNFKHTGVFPEQANNWDYITRKVSSAGRRLSILNLFAYTGAATLASAAAGAEVCHVDASKGAVAWARENAKISGLEGAPIRWIVDDCVKFIEREIRRGRRYDAIIMDPPSYGRGPAGEVWKLEDNLFDFVRLASRALSAQPEFVIINSYTAGLSPSTLKYIADAVFTAKLGGRAESDELGLPVTQSGLCLPCGAATRWEIRRGATEVNVCQKNQ
ncbi:MAG: class I SAM-dependent methyltransferase [Oscillospiraceae bacterium]|jgi:23S rRNA (cytosine1962-C5)-methyltransferase|nr:class I SAM-dependent methyltransferase [Oscillospiraceae bacterium]